MPTGVSLQRHRQPIPGTGRLTSRARMGGGSGPLGRRCCRRRCAAAATADSIGPPAARCGAAAVPPRPTCVPAGLRALRFGEGKAELVLGDGRPSLLSGQTGRRCREQEMRACGCPRAFHGKPRRAHACALPPAPCGPAAYSHHSAQPFEASQHADSPPLHPRRRSLAWCGAMRGGRASGRCAAALQARLPLAAPACVPPPCRRRSCRRRRRCRRAPATDSLPPPLPMQAAPAGRHAAA